MTDGTEKFSGMQLMSAIAGVALLIGAPGYFYYQSAAPDRARDAVIRQSVLDVLKSPSSADFIEVRALQTKFTVTVDAQNSYGAMTRSTFMGDFEQTCERASSRDCWRAEVTGSLPQ